VSPKPAAEKAHWSEANKTAQSAATVRGRSSTRTLQYWLPLIIWLGVIYSFSTDEFSANNTAGFIVPILHFLFPGLTPEQLSLWHAVIRKLGHITEYAILAWLTYRAVRFDETDPLKAKVRTFQFLVLAAMTDEFHQSLTMSRGASVIDVGYDSFGGLILLWIATLVKK
jgi:VanZ family protein